MSWQGRIVVDSKILVGKPVVKGTRLAVEFIIELLAQGWPEEDIVRNYPGMTREDIRACLSYASSVLRAEKVYPQEVEEPYPDIPPEARPSTAGSLLKYVGTWVGDDLETCLKEVHANRTKSEYRHG